MQTVVIGSGAIQTTVWIPEVGVAACSNRSKVTLQSQQTIEYESRDVLEITTQAPHFTEEQLLSKRLLPAQNNVPI